MWYYHHFKIWILSHIIIIDYIITSVVLLII